MSLNEQHELMERLAKCLASISSAEVGVEVLNLVNMAYALGYRDADGREHVELRSVSGEVHRILHISDAHDDELGQPDEQVDEGGRQEFPQTWPDQGTLIRLFANWGDTTPSDKGVIIRCQHPLHYGQPVAEVVPGGPGMITIPVYE